MASETHRIRRDPYEIFAENTHPAAMNARRRWLGEHSRAFHQLENERREAFSEGQQPSGSLGSVRQTIERLFALFLLGAKPTPAVRQALDFLLDRKAPSLDGVRLDGIDGTDLFFHLPHGEKSGLAELSGTPFFPGHAGILKSSAALFFASVFRCDRREDVRRAGQALLSRSGEGGDLCKARTSRLNVLLALSSHPSHRGHSATLRTVAPVARWQRPDGRFGSAPFLPVLWTLSLQNGRKARAILRRSLPALLRGQQADGSWGRKDPEFQTWMAVEVLKRMGVIP